MNKELLTPYELGDQNQTTTWEECIAFYTALEKQYPRNLRFFQIGNSDAGTPVHAGIVSMDGVSDLNEIRRSNRPVFFNNNGIHPGEPEGIDACMALVRDLCTRPELLRSLKQTVFLFIPVYNVDGCRNRQNSSRVNQQGPEQFGFRGNANHLDLNRDFIKCDSQNAQIFNRFFSDWDPDVMVDTHTSNGADYSYTMTVIQTQPDKLGGELGQFVRETMLPELAEKMSGRGWPICPYVNPVRETPGEGIEDFLDLPRFSTGYAALNHTVGFMPETHMLKSYRDRYLSMRVFVEEVLAFTVKHSHQIQALRAAAREKNNQKEWPLTWQVNRNRVSRFKFSGYTARQRPSVLGNYSRLYYDRDAPFSKEIDYFQHYEPEVQVTAPGKYIVPAEWREVILRLDWNKVNMERVSESRTQTVQTYHIKSVTSRSMPYEGHMFHDQVELETRMEAVQLKAGDFLVPVQQKKARYVIETLEPLAHDSLFRWGFFNSILEKKETYSSYVFEDTASELLQADPELRSRFERWQQENPQLLSSQEAVLDFIFFNCRQYSEPEWRRYPIFRLID